MHLRPFIVSARLPQKSRCALAVLREVEADHFLFVIDGEANGEFEREQQHQADQAAPHQGHAHRFALDDELRHRAIRAADRRRREHAGQQRADDPADTVHPERVQAVVVAEHVFEVGCRQEADHARRNTNRDRTAREDKTRSRRDGDETRHRARDDAEHRGFALGDPLRKHPGQRGSGGGDLRHRHCHAGTPAGTDRGARVEAEPADPQQRGADHREGEVMRRHVLVPVATTLAHHQAAHQPGDACVDVHHRAAGVVQGAHGREPAGRRPHPVRDCRVGEDRPADHEDAHRRELHPLGERTGDQRRGDDRERHLEHHVDGFGDGVGHRGDPGDAIAENKAGVVLLGEIGGDAVEHQARHVAEVGCGCAGAAGKRQRVADDGPDDGDQAADREGLHDGRQDVLLPNHAGVEEGEAGNGHHQHECGAGEHPGGIAMVIGRRFGGTRGSCRRSRCCGWSLGGSGWWCGSSRRGCVWRRGCRGRRRGLGEGSAGHQHGRQQQAGGERQGARLLQTEPFEGEGRHGCVNP